MLKSDTDIFSRLQTEFSLEAGKTCVLNLSLLEFFPDAATWNTRKLIDDINAVRKRLDSKGNISQMHEYYMWNCSWS